MQRKKYRPLLILSIACMLIASTACSKNEKEAANTASPAPTTPTSATGQPVEAIDPLGKFDPPIEVTSVRDVSASTQFRPGESISNNVWSREYEEKLGIKVKYLWTTNGDYIQKLNVSIASGELADIFGVRNVQLKQLVETNQLEDLTEIFEKYASPLTKKIINEDPRQLNSAKYNGKLMGIPHVGSPSDFSEVLWIRADWLKKLNLPEPKTMDDVFRIAEAFVTQDPDGNNKADTYGLGMTSGLATLKGFYNGYHAYPYAWIKDETGKLVYGSIQPEVKQALGKLQEMYKNKWIDREFAVKDPNKAIELLTSGKIGMQYGAWWNPTWPLQMNKDQDPDADWKSYGLPSIDSDTAKLQLDFPTGEYYVVKKGAKNPEAAIKMLNLMVDHAFSETADIENFFIANDGFLYNNYPLLYVAPVNGNLKIHLNLTKALEAKDPSTLNSEEKGYYDKIMAYRGGDNKNWYQEGMYGNISAWPSVKEKLDQNAIQYEEFYGTPTKTMGQKGAVLAKMMTETFTKIIMGEVPLDDFDTFVKNWKNLGGDEITKEVNEWAEQQQQ
ncbi:extracellular solute-binding protein [Paenibacillus eucommiae]|uniref:Aldouronate transport system substrate-binding protein n=1 Tax=Paenibacillus eucommiae TaxID=1355755 RepID=A0ABS4IT69_9BACL|nr:extracellular solute-binding protein [Paenibacillus eucommiae]MBP1990753.1 putative aldouronate transport system substrate-binding protein [Paenibacillus eucommiae]